MPEKILLQATLAFLIRRNRVLLAIKTRGIGKDRRNGYGGGIDPGESAEEAMLRELPEESTVTTDLGALEKVAIVDFHNTTEDGRIFVCRVHVYLVRKWVGEIQDTEEMVNPQWFDFSKLPLENMLPADKRWLPLVLSGSKILATAHYGPHQRELLRPMEITFIENFPS